MKHKLHHAALALAATAPLAHAAGEFDFEAPKPYPVITAIRPQQQVTLRICAKREWLDTYVSHGALWPGPPYKVNLAWEAKKWTWAPPQHLPVTTLLTTIEGAKVCSPPVHVRHADFPLTDDWRVRARLQFDKGVQSGPAERVIKVLPAILKKSMPNDTVMPVPDSQPARRTPRGG
jgi:hypothetical protein